MTKGGLEVLWNRNRVYLVDCIKREIRCNKDFAEKSLSLMLIEISEKFHKWSHPSYTISVRDQNGRWSNIRNEWTLSSQLTTSIIGDYLDMYLVSDTYGQILISGREMDEPKDRRM
jgi:hypothetical protein